MSETLSVLAHRMTSAEELKSVVRTMKAIAAANIVRYEQAVRALDVYDDTVRRGLAVALREQSLEWPNQQHSAAVVVFGSDQGLVGQFNDDLSDFVVAKLAGVRQPVVWAVGERVAWGLTSKALVPMATLAVPLTLHAITGLVAQLLEGMEPWMLAHPLSPVLVMHQRPQPGEQFEAVSQRLLPLDEEWRQSLFAAPWP